MLISIDGYDRPTITWTTGGTGVTVLTSTAYLSDNLVVSPCRMTWATGSQTTSTTVTITATFASTVLRCAGLLCPLSTGYSLPVGLKVTVDSGLGGNATTQRTQRLPDGSVGIYWAFPAGSAVTTITFTIYNDVNGSTYFTAGQVFDIGEAWAGGGTVWKIANNVESNLVDTITNRRSHNNQAQPIFHNPYESTGFSFTPMTDTSAYDPTSALSFKQMRYRLLTAKSALVMPLRHVRGTTTVDPVPLHALTLFGRPDAMQALTGNNDRYWTAKLTMSAAPP